MRQEAAVALMRMMTKMVIHGDELVRRTGKMSGEGPHELTLARRLRSCSRRIPRGVLRRERTETLQRKEDSGRNGEGMETLPEVVMTLQELREVPTVTLEGDVVFLPRGEDVGISG